jgi:UDP-glucuronate decarboxylase
MLGLAKRTGARLLYASTSEVYGDPLVSPQRETDLGNVNCTGPRACYDEGKRMGETLCFDYARVHGLSITVARIFNTYGPRMSGSDGRVVTNFIRQALQGEPLTVYGSGEQTRSFCYCTDLVSGLQALMASTVQGPVNLGNPEEISIRELARRIANRVNPEVRLIHEPLPIDDPHQRRPCIDRAANELGWRPMVTLDEGLNPTIESLRSEIKQRTYNLV